MRRRSVGSILISNLDPNLKERILNLPIPRESLKKFDEEEKRNFTANLVDLRDLPSKNETEVYNTLNMMYKNKQ